MPGWLSLGEAAEQLAKSRRISIEAARVALLADLASGKRQARGILEPKYWKKPAPPSFQPIDEAFWALAAKDPNANLWMKHFDPDDPFEFAGPAYSDPWPFERGYVSSPRARVSYSEIQVLDDAAGRAPVRRGRPSSYDWQDFDDEVRRLEKSGISDKKALFDHMLDYVAGWETVPDDRTVRERIRLIRRG